MREVDKVTDAASEDVQASALQRGRERLSPFKLPADTAPTWEVELLLSGATLFALMQIPGWLDGHFDTWTARLDGTGVMLLTFGWLYAKIIVYAIIVALLVHLLARGLWVAAVGLRSVHPQGIRWRRLRNGPRFRAAARGRVPHLKALIARSDDISSQMFALAALLVLTTLYSASMTALVALLGWGASQLLFGGDWLLVAIVALGALLSGTQTAGALLDRRAGRDGRRRPRRLRWLSMFFRWMLALPFARLTYSLMLVFTSRVGSIRGTVILMVMMYALIGLAILDLTWSRESPSFGPAAFIAALDGPDVIDPGHYLLLRGGDPRHLSTPYIDAKQIEGDYLQLVIPFQPRRHPQAIEAFCPGVGTALEQARENSGHHFGGERGGPAAEDQAEWSSEAVRIEQAEHAAIAAYLDCATRLHAPRINGERIQGLRLAFLQQADLGQPALVSQLSVRELGRGAHVLSVQRLPAQRRDGLFGAEQERPPAPPLQIRFWK
ncbi:MAG: hypothetical protein MEQ07_00325 [Aquimonas sp.]|nr:hypothetical protein [Aquimonas sp.]